MAERLDLLYLHLYLIAITVSILNATKEPKKAKIICSSLFQNGLVMSAHVVNAAHVLKKITIITHATNIQGHSFLNFVGLKTTDAFNLKMDAR